MRILFLDTKPIRRGAQIFSHDLSTQFMRSGIDTKRIYLYKNNNHISLSIDKQDELFEGDEKSFMEKIFIVQPQLFLRLIRSIRKYNPDIILLNGSRTLKYGALAKAFVDKKCRFVYRVIDSPKFWNTKTTTKFLYKKIVIPFIDAAVGVSFASMQDMISLYGFTKKSIVIHRAVNFDNFRNVPHRKKCREKLKISNDSFVILFLGNLTSQKRPDRFIEIIHSLCHRIPNLKAIMVGDGPLKDDVKKKIEEFELSAIITLYGYREDVGPYISASDILLLTSDTEGLPGVVPEAGFFSVPSIASNVGGVNECIESEVSGFLVEKEDIQGYIEKIDLLFSKIERYRNMGDAAKLSAEKNFNIKKISEYYLNFFDSLLNNQ